MALSLTRFFGRTASEGAAFAMGTAVAPALRPLVQDIYNETWSAHPSRPLDAATLAEGVVRGHLAHDWAAGEAERVGINGDRFDRLIRSFRAGPGVASAFELWRRGIIAEQGFRRALTREGLEADWIADLVELRNVLLSPADLAMARQQGFIDRARQYEEAGKQGVTNERAELMFELSGLPPGVETGLEMLRRGIITEAEFGRIVREGHTKTKYTDELLELERVLLSPATLVALHLKGWIAQGEFHNRMADWGYTAGDADDWYKAAGRPAAPVQMFQAWARGAPGPYGGTVDHDDFVRAIRQSDIRPEYAETLWAIRHAYPSLFQLRRAVQEGGISRARALEILHFERYEESDARAMVNSWLAGSGTTAKGLTASDLLAEYEGSYITREELLAELEGLGYSAEAAAGKATAAEARRVKTYRDAAIRAVRKRYNVHRATDAEARASLAELALPADAIEHLLRLWAFERTEKAAVLTPAQIKRAFGHDIIDRATAVAELEARGYSADDARILLDE